VLITLSRWATLAASLTMFLVYFRGGSLVIRDTKRSVETTGDTINLIAIAVMFIAGPTVLFTQILSCLHIVTTAPLVENEWLIALGALLVVIDIAAAFWIRHRYLKDLWSGNVEIRENHPVIKDGPYQIVRHPLYALTLLIYLGVALVFAFWWNWIACGVMFIGYIWLTAYEDNYLRGNLPGYQDYQRQAKYRLVPGIW
jgi:protein-S-isoprenylcysteine O-methyltransferase Ste14